MYADPLLLAAAQDKPHMKVPFFIKPAACPAAATCLLQPLPVLRTGPVSDFNVRQSTRSLPLQAPQHLWTSRTQRRRIPASTSAILIRLRDVRERGLEMHERFARIQDSSREHPARSLTHSLGLFWAGTVMATWAAADSRCRGNPGPESPPRGRSRVELLVRMRPRTS